MPPDSFRDIFNKVFQIRLTYPEVGVLLSILDVGGNGALDGAKFVNWFFKISRKEEKFMLGEKSIYLWMIVFFLSILICTQASR